MLIALEGYINSKCIGAGSWVFIAFVVADQDRFGELPDRYLYNR